MRRFLVATAVIGGILLPIAPSLAAGFQPASCTVIKTGSSNPTLQISGKDVVLPCLDGKSLFVLNKIKGPVVVNVWGSWCEPCNQEFPYFVALQKSGKVKLLGVDVEERNTAVAQKFVAKKRIPWPNIYDENSVTRSLFGLGVPVTWFIDANGKVAGKHIGVMKSKAELYSQIKKYLGISA